MLEKQNALTLLYIKSDMQTILQLFEFVKDKKYNSYFYLGITPYISLMSYESFMFFLKGNKLNDNLEKNMILNLQDLRLKTKLFDNRFNQTIQLIKNIDFIQHKEFFEEKNKYNNIGLLLDKRKHIIYNTHLGYWFICHDKLSKLSDENIVVEYENGNIPTRDEMKGIAFDNGRYNGTICSSVFNTLRQLDKEQISKFKDIEYEIRHTDKNTKFDYKIFGSGNLVFYRLYYIHLLSMVNFIIYFINQITVKDYGVLFKINYLCYHYIIKSLHKIYNYQKQNNKIDFETEEFFNKIVFINDPLDSKLRNAMMHYKIDEDIVSSMDFENVNSGNVVERLVEAITDEKFEKTKSKIRERLCIISEELNKYLDIKLKNIKKL